MSTTTQKLSFKVHSFSNTFKFTLLQVVQMTKKPTYEELEVKAKSLELELAVSKKKDYKSLFPLSTNQAGIILSRMSEFVNFEIFEIFEKTENSSSKNKLSNSTPALMSARICSASQLNPTSPARLSR